jgi:lipoprotein NlpD
MKYFVLAIFVFFNISCAVTRGGFLYKVNSGETLNQIANKFQLPERVLVRTNDIKNVNVVLAGSYLYIPIPKNKYDDDIFYNPKKPTKRKIKKFPSNKKSQSSSIEKVRKTTSKSASSEKSVKVSPSRNTKISNSSSASKKNNINTFKQNSNNKYFLWPVKGKVVTYFSKLTRGINLETKENENIKSCGAGTVIYSNFIQGYGKTVIVRHNENYMSVYSYLKKIAVSQSQSISPGTVLGISGNTVENRKYKKPVLHFEIRKTIDGSPIAVNPLSYLK